MEYTSINIQGNIISSEILDKIRSEDVKHQKSEAFGLSKDASIRDEIGMAWSVIRSHWVAYKKRLETLPKHDTGTSLTREKWIIPLLGELGFELTYLQKNLVINEKPYAISHQAANRGNFPVLVMGYNDDLDKRRENSGPKQSPHSLVQEYLNHTEHLYGLITNGKQLRLLRDATRLVRLSYLEFDLEKIMEEELYADFALLFRTLHASRMPDEPGQGEHSVIEEYHQESLASGTRIREKLSDAVEQSIKTLANGFLQHPKNADFVARFEKGQISADDYYLHLLRLIYRVLFIIVIEERKLIYPDKRDETISRFRNIYFQYYSVERIRKLVERNAYVDEDKTDLWKGLVTTFLLFEKEHYGKKLGIDPLGSGLFSPSAIGVLPDQYIFNKDLLQVIRHLTTFENDQRQTVRVNYSDLDVEEFGSVYEGLLEYDPSVELSGGRWHFTFVEGEGRSSSGSHYTPEELVKPLIKHSLDYVIQDKLKEEDPEKALLSIKVCDVACGSGHILLSAARRIATELACFREKAEQPSPPEFRKALREAIKSCIYGVDLNPLAVELCKVALWLEAHNPGEPLNFLDHHIKCGNAIVGLANYKELNNGIPSEAFKSLQGDDPDISKKLRILNNKDRDNRISKGQLSTKATDETVEDIKNIVSAIDEWVLLPEQTPEQVTEKANRYTQIKNRQGWKRLEQLADLQVAQFFIPKTNETDLMLDAEYFSYLTDRTMIKAESLVKSIQYATERRFFHWFLEFPEVMNNGGFDTILGNPPFLGGQKLTGTFGNDFTEYLKYEFAPIGLVDFVTYFFRRNYSLIKNNGFISLISTNTIAQGDSREDGLGQIIKQGGTINHAVKAMKWPGLANVFVSLVSIYKGEWLGVFELDQGKVNQITLYLDSHERIGDPFPLTTNANKSFQGSIILGKGFILDPEEAKELIAKDPKNKDVIYPYLNGNDLNNRVDQSPSRWVINFFDWPERRYSKEEWEKLVKSERATILKRIKDEKFVPISPPDYEGQVAMDYPDSFEIIEKKVKPERKRWKLDKSGNEIEGTYALRKPLPENWWIYGEKRPALYEKIGQIASVFVHTRVTKTHAFASFSDKIVFSEATIVFAFASSADFTLLQSSFNEWWAWNYSSTMKGDRRYSPSDSFENLPFPKNLDNLINIGKQYYKTRKELMKLIQLGLTKTYNQFHNQELISNVEDLANIEFQKKYGKETWNLYKHLEVDKSGQIGYAEAVEKINELRKLHVEMDEAVLAAYGWHEDSEKWGPAIQLKHDFYEVDYLPENDRVRYTIHPEARKEVLKRLLLLNHERWEEEAREGLHTKKTVEKFYAEKGEPIPEDIAVHFQKGNEKSKATKSKSALKSKATPKEQTGMFGSEPEVKKDLKVNVHSCVTLVNLNDQSELKFRIVSSKNDRQLVMGYENRVITDQLCLQVLNMRAGFQFELEGVKYQVKGVE